MAKMIFEKTAGAVGILVSALFLRQTVLTLFAVYFIHNIDLNPNI